MIIKNNMGINGNPAGISIKYSDGINISNSKF